VGCRESVFSKNGPACSPFSVECRAIPRRPPHLCRPHPALNNGEIRLPEAGRGGIGPFCSPRNRFSKGTRTGS
jgi:hypothetical protein